jgi:hypothetical protein
MVTRSPKGLPSWSLSPTGLTFADASQLVFRHRPTSCTTGTAALAADTQRERLRRRRRGAGRGPSMWQVGSGDAPPLTRMLARILALHVHAQLMEWNCHAIVSAVRGVRNRAAHRYYTTFNLLRGRKHASCPRLSIFTHDPDDGIFAASHSGGLVGSRLLASQRRNR